MEWFGLAGYVLLVVALVRLYGRLDRRRRRTYRVGGYVWNGRRVLTPGEVDHLKEKWLSMRHKPGVWLR